MTVANNQEHVDPKHVAEDLLGKIKWLTDTKGSCTCPGVDRHSSKAGDRECIVYLDGAPTIFCFHQSCGEDVAEANRQLRYAVATGAEPSNASKREIKLRRQEEAKASQLGQRAHSSLNRFLELYQWPIDSIQDESPDAPNAQLDAQWRDVVSLFKAGDVIWIGEKHDSGSQGHRSHFKTAEDWLKTDSVAGLLTCPATFKPDSFGRKNENIEARRFLVVESDVLKKDEVGAIFKWLRDDVGMSLRAVIDTAGKSLHAWFDYPKQSIVNQLEIILPQLGCDKGLFTASQPCRIAGALRDGKYQQLLYLDKTTKRKPLKVPSTVLPLPELYYASFAQCYWRKTASGGWQKINEKALQTELKAQGYSFDEEPGELLSEGLKVQRNIQLHQDVAYTGRLAGYTAGVHEICGRKVLVTEAPKILIPKTGDWSTLNQLIEGLFKTEVCDQTPYVYGWIKCGYEALRTGNVTRGQALAIAGPKGSGKSLFQNLITEMFGGRIAKPYHFMTGRTAFNSEMFAAEHLMIEDEPASTRIEARRNFGTMIKTITANETQPCFTKGAEAITLKPFWRLSITMNEEPEDLMVLPPFEDGIDDKIILLKAKRSTMPMPTDDADERATFWSALMAEIPAFLAFLTDWQIPNGVKDSRWGIATFHHPELLEKVKELAPETRLLSLIDSCTEMFPVLKDEWQGTALKLEQMLTDVDWSLHHQARTLFQSQSTCGKLLGRLASQHPDRVCKDRISNGYTVWKITRSNGVN